LVCEVFQHWFRTVGASSTLFRPSTEELLRNSWFEKLSQKIDGAMFALAGKKMFQEVLSMLWWNCWHVV